MTKDDLVFLIDELNYIVDEGYMSEAEADKILDRASRLDLPEFYVNWDGGYPEVHVLSGDEATHYAQNGGSWLYLPCYDVTKVSQGGAK